MTNHLPIQFPVARGHFFSRAGAVRRLRSSAFLLGVLLAAAFAGGAHAETRVDDAWARATIGAQRTSGAFMTITSDVPARLIAASSPVAGITEIHEMTLIDNVMRMRPVESLTLPAGEAVMLRPGGYHVMLLDLKAALDEGATVPLTLTIEGDDGRRSEVVVQAVVRSATQRHDGNAGAPMHGHENARHGH